ncbi:fumarylacetoacetate hydrolase family protein [Xanthobacter sp. 126]|uniref:fumarylacetoacetate hydrolase family protein n=1 Tax=Xanthobacter sp. 126 TaxID=1131814 RepID=UPI00045E733D|nr:fumarylacetoacetate hydrolase family protein [Xanthobacter sp. 126]
MKLVTFVRKPSADQHLGVVLDDAVFDLTATGKPEFESMLSLIRAGAVDAAKALAEAARGVGSGVPGLVPLEDVTLLAPIPRPAKNIFCVGRNYIDHVTEGYKARGLDLKLPEFPQFFSKPPTTVIATGDTIPLHEGITNLLDYEIELAIVIGRDGRDIPAADWRKYVFGYTVLNDITGRDLQRRHDQWFKGKGLDGSCPIGPCIVTDDAIADPQKLDLWLEVNGERRQAANTSQMIFDLPRIIEDLSRGMTLEAGDIIATGTPSGVGYAMTPPHPLQRGDLVTCHIEGIGTLQNRIG